MYFVYMYENRTMKPVEIVQRKGEGNEREWRREWIYLRYIVSTYMNVIITPHVQVISANKNLKN
jgi:hypothetical protein